MDRGDLLKTALSRNVVLISILALFLHNTGGRAIPRVDIDQKTVDVVWLALMSGVLSIVELVGVGSQVVTYQRAVADGRIERDDAWEWGAYVVAGGTVLLFGILYPVLFVAVDQ